MDSVDKENEAEELERNEREDDEDDEVVESVKYRSTLEKTINAIDRIIQLKKENEIDSDKVYGEDSGEHKIITNF